LTPELEAPTFRFEPKLQTVDLVFTSEESARKCLAEIQAKKYNEKTLDCLLIDENLYVTIVEEINASNRNRYP